LRIGKTNAAAYELYGIFGEANGQSLPLGFVFTTMTDGSASTGAKQRMLTETLTWLAKRCPNILFTLSDKDPSEINACRASLIKAKHQLCYWHGVRYVDERLAEDKPPAAYDPRKAHEVFSFIDPMWAPGVTRGEIEEYFDGRDLEAGANIQGGTRKQLEEIRQVSMDPTYTHSGLTITVTSRIRNRQPSHHLLSSSQGTVDCQYGPHLLQFVAPTFHHSVLQHIALLLRTNMSYIFISTPKYLLMQQVLT
jgi:hypothetical protein